MKSKVKQKIIVAVISLTVLSILLTSQTVVALEGYTYHAYRKNWWGAYLFADLYMKCRQTSSTNIYVSYIEFTFQLRTETLVPIVPKIPGVSLLEGHFTYAKIKLYYKGRVIYEKEVLPRGSDFTGYIPTSKTIYLYDNAGAGVSAVLEFEVEGYTAYISFLGIVLWKDQFSLHDSIDVVVWVNGLGP